jgi:regulator of RNase E activity RraA
VFSASNTSPAARLHLPGDLIGEIMVNKGVLRAVIDGTVRDAETLATQGLVVFA